MKQKRLYEVEYFTYRNGCGYRRAVKEVYATDELDACCRVCDMYPEGFGFEAKIAGPDSLRGCQTF